MTRSPPTPAHRAVALRDELEVVQAGEPVLGQPVLRQHHDLTTRCLVKASSILRLEAHLEIVIFGQQRLARLPVVQLGRVVPQQALLATRPQEDGEPVHAAALLRGDTGGD